MFKRLLTRRSSVTEPALSRGELEHGDLPTRPEILIFGSNNEGAAKLHDALEGFLGRTGLDGVEVNTWRYDYEIPGAFFGQREGTRIYEDRPRTLPIGVLLLSHMRVRQFDENSTVRTDSRPWGGGSIAEGVVQLCTQYGVPLVRVPEGAKFDNEAAVAGQFAALAQPPRAIEQ